MNTSRILASSCRQKILKSLLEFRELNVMGLVRKINSTYNQVDRNLQILEKEGIIAIQRRGRLRMIMLNHENLKTTILIKALRILDTPTRLNTRSTS